MVRSGQLNAYPKREEGRVSTRAGLRCLVVGGFVALGLVVASAASAQRSVPVEVANADPIPVVMTSVATAADTTTTVCMGVEMTCAAKGATLAFGCFPAESLSFRASRPLASGTTGSTRLRGDVVLGELVIAAAPGSYSPKLFDAIATGKVFAEVGICMADAATGASRLEYELGNAMVTDWATVAGATTPGGGPVDSLSFDFENVIYRIHTPNGKVESSWSVE